MKPKRAERRSRSLLKFIKRLQKQIDHVEFKSEMRGGQERGWKDVEAFKKDNHWLILLKNTGTLCSCDGCGNQRHNKHMKKKARLTRQELKALTDFMQQLKDLENENPDS